MQVKTILVTVCAMIFAADLDVQDSHCEGGTSPSVLVDQFDRICSQDRNRDETALTTTERCKET